MAEEEKPKQATKQRVYTVSDMRDLRKRDDYSAFGNMQLSYQPTEPVVNIGRATRDKRAKVYQSKENMKAFLGNRLSLR
jgi:hypothetical protein